MIKPDNIQFLSTLPNYINIANSPGTISISGTLPDTAVQDYSVTISTSRNNTRFDVYGTNQNTQTKQLFSNTTVPVNYQNSGGELANIIISYAPTQMSVTIELTNNTGSPITLINQTFGINIVQYQIPY